MKAGDLRIPILKDKMKEPIVKEIPKPFEGQFAFAQDGTYCVYKNGKWVTYKERNTSDILANISDCI